MRECDVLRFKDDELKWWKTSKISGCRIPNSISKAFENGDIFACFVFFKEKFFWFLFTNMNIAFYRKNRDFRYFDKEIFGILMKRFSVF